MKYNPKLIQGTNAALHICMIATGEWMQEATKSGLMDYNWAVGHLSDIGASGFYTSLFLSMSNKLKSKLAIVLGVPLFLSATEFIPVFWKVGTVYDSQDLLCYWGGALLAFGVKEVSERMHNKDIKPTLEEELS